MPRGRKPRTWIKMDCEGILHGSINYLFMDGSYEGEDIKEISSLACQAIWMKMIVYSEVCGGRPGFIEDNNQNGLPHGYIAQELHCPVNIFKAVLKIMEGDGAININGTCSIELVNFSHYQFTEYDRQKPYRDAKKQGTEKFKNQKHEHMIASTQEDIDRIKEIRKKGEPE